jgi:hypothetical protein
MTSRLPMISWLNLKRQLFTCAALEMISAEASEGPVAEAGLAPI